MGVVEGGKGKSWLAGLVGWVRRMRMEKLGTGGRIGEVGMGSLKFVVL